MWRRVAILFAILLLAAPVKRAQSSGIPFQITSALSPASGWLGQTTDTDARLRGVSAVDTSVVWASGSKGTFLHTTDSGLHWQSGVVADAADLDFRAVHGVSASTAYLLSAGEGEQSRIYKTTDAGKSWNLQFTNEEPKGFFDGFAFWDATHGIAFSDPVDGRFLIVRTMNGGATWSPIPAKNSPAALPGEAAFAASGSSIIVNGSRDVWFATGGGTARVFHSGDQGLTWSVADTPILSGSLSAGIFSIVFADRKRGFIVGGDYQKVSESNANFAWTKDGGRTWTPGPRLSGYRSAVSVIETSPVHIVAVGPTGIDSWSPGWASWISETDTAFDAASFIPNRNSGWAVGPMGRIAAWHGHLRHP